MTDFYCMHRWKKVLRWVLIGLLLLPLLGMLAMEGVDRYLASDRGAKWFYRKVPASVTVLHTDNGLRYLEIGDPALPALLLLHGSPGGLFDWRSMAVDSAVTGRFRLLVVERPGYGGTKPRGAEPSIRAQASRCLEVLAREKQPVVLMGYSYGAPVAMAMAGLAPNRITGVVGVSGQYNPNDEMILRISPFLRWGVFRFLMPRMLWVSNEEKMNHFAALEEVLPLFDNVQAPILLLHGDADAIVPYDNSPWLAERLGGKPRVVTLPGVDHGVPFGHMDVLVNVVLTLPSAEGRP